MKNLDVLSCTVRPKEIQFANFGRRSIPFVVDNARDGLTRNRYYKQLGTAPRVSTF